MNRVLLVCPNISDAILGCGGILVRHVDGGDNVRVMILSDGLTSRARSLEFGLQAMDLDSYEQQGREALAILGIDEVEFFRLPDNRLDQLPLLDIVKIIEKEKNCFQPDIIYTTSDSDLGMDQKRTSLAVVTAFRPQPDENQSSLYAFEVNSSTEWNFCERERNFIPDTFVDINNTLNIKIKAFQSMKLEQRTGNHARSVEAVINHAKLRGCQVGVQAAEALMLMRSIRSFT